MVEISRLKFLFSSQDWEKLRQTFEESVTNDIRNLDADTLVMTPEEKLVRTIADENRMKLPILHPDKTSYTQNETIIESHRSDYGRSDFVKEEGTEYEFYLPFSGMSEFLQVELKMLNRIKASSDDHGIKFFLSGVSLTGGEVQGKADEFIASVQNCLDKLTPAVKAWNDGLPDVVRAPLEARRNRLIADRKAASEIKFQMRARFGATTEDLAPTVRRRIIPRRTPPVPSKMEVAPEPVLDKAEYEHILSVIGAGALMMERSPRAFHGMGEEDIRMLLLVLLNSHYEDQVTGETFNGDGKTDILVRSDGRNVFIAECKIWSGPSTVSESLDQLLKYIVWRDTKAALILFSRNRGFDAVLSQIQALTEAHPNYLTFDGKLEDTVFKFTFSQRDEPARRMTLTVMAFSVPTP